MKSVIINTEGLHRRHIPVNVANFLENVFYRKLFNNYIFFNYILE